MSWPPRIEWKRIFRVTVEDLDLVWESIELRANERVAFVVTAWHYADADAAPRLVTAYPKPYNRGNGSYG